MIVSMFGYSPGCFLGYFVSGKSVKLGIVEMCLTRVGTRFGLKENGRFT
jgi:hypothetical protein